MNKLFQKDLCSVLVVHFDLMHCRYLGYLQQLFGSVFWLLCEEMMQRSPLVNLHELWNFLKTYQAEHKVHSPYSQRLNKLSMYKKQTDFPKLRGKASEIKNMAAAMEAMWSFFAIPGQDFQEIGLLLRLTCEFEEILQEWPISSGHFCLPAEAANRLKASYENFACLYVMVGDRFRSEGRRAFNPTEKILCFFNVASFVPPTNPRTPKPSKSRSPVETRHPLSPPKPHRSSFFRKHLYKDACLPAYRHAQSLDSSSPHILLERGGARTIQRGPAFAVAVLIYVRSFSAVRGFNFFGVLCFGSREDYMSKLSTQMASCCRGVQREEASHKLNLKMRLALHLEWQKLAVTPS